MAAAATNPIFQVREIEGKGRGVISSRPIKGGEIILKDTPILVYSANPLNHNSCSNCFKNLHLLPPSSILPCPTCSSHALFCSPKCQSTALASSHSPWVCQALNSLHHSTPPLDISEAHFLIAAYNLAAFSPSQFNLLLSLQGDASTSTPQTLALHNLIASLSPPQSFAGFSLELTTALLAKDKRNGFAIMEPFQENGEREARAFGIYPNAAFFNHDCLPNAARFDYVDNDGGTEIVVRAIHDLDQGREFCLSYFPVTWNFKDRQRRLLEEYGFVCECDRCKVEVNWKDDDDDDEDEDGGGDDSMGENEDEQMVGEKEEGEQGDDDFPHAYFFLTYVCSTENCRGTLAPLPPSEGSPSDIMECNVCGQLRSREEIERDGTEDGVMIDE